MDVIITHPDFKDYGGVTAYFTKLRGHFQCSVQHFIVGKRPGEPSGLMSELSRLLRDYYQFIRLLKGGQCDVVHVNPSLDVKALLRDGVFVLLGKAFGKTVIVFFHGWNRRCERTLQRYGLRLFQLLFGKADAFIVLADEFKHVFESWGMAQKIYREIMVIDDATLEGFKINEVLAERQKSENWRICFLSRITKNKGVFETIEAVSLLQQKYPGVELIIAGDGDELENARSFVNSRAIPNVTFTGYVVGEEKARLLRSSHIFCFPTTYGEGLPNTVIESMAFGLPVVTRPVGGIADFFKHEEHGYLTQSTQPAVLAGLIEQLFVDQQLYRRMSLSNYYYAQKHLLASHAVARLERIYAEAIK